MRPSFKKRAQSELSTESSNRAQRLNQAADRMLCKQLSDFDREEKHLQKELAILRKSREVLDVGLRPMLSPRARSNTLPVNTESDYLRCKTPHAHSVQKLPQIVPKSPIPTRNTSPWMVGPSPWLKSPDASPTERRRRFLSVSEEFRLHRAHSSGDLEQIFQKVNDGNSDESSVRQAAGEIKSDHVHNKQDSNEAAEEEKEEEEDEQEEDKKCAARGRSLSDFTKESFLRSLIPSSYHADVTGLHVSVPLAPPSPRLLQRRGSSFLLQSSKTNVDLANDMKISSKFRAIGHSSLGQAVMSRLKENLQDAKNLDENRHATLRRRGTLGHVNCISSKTDTNNNIKNVNKEDSNPIEN